MGQPGKRLQRPGALALGQPAALPWTLLVVNLLAVLLGTAATLDMLRTLGANRWLALAYAFSPPVLLGTLATLAEPTSFASWPASRSRRFRGGAGTFTDQQPERR